MIFKIMFRGVKRVRMRHKVRVCGQTSLGIWLTVRKIDADETPLKSFK